MFDDLPPLTHEEQQKAVERIQVLMAQGVSTAEAIKIIAQEIRDTVTYCRSVKRC